MLLVSCIFLSTAGECFAVTAADSVQTVYTASGDEIYRIVFNGDGTMKIIGTHFGGVAPVTYQTVGFCITAAPAKGDLKKYAANGGKVFEFRFDDNTTSYVNGVVNNGIVTTTYTFPADIMERLFLFFGIAKEDIGDYFFYISNVFRVIYYINGRGKPFVYLSDAYYSLAGIRSGAAWGQDTINALAHYYDMKFVVSRKLIRTEDPPTPTCKPTNTPTPKPTNTLTPTPKPTNTPTPKPSNTPTPTRKPTNTPTPKPTNTPTPTPKPTNTPTPKPSNTPAPRPSDTPSPSPTSVPAQAEAMCILGIYGDNAPYVQHTAPDKNAVQLVTDSNMELNDLYIRILNNKESFNESYIIRNEVSFPIDVFADEGIRGFAADDRLVTAYSWYETGYEAVRFYTKDSVKEGSYVIRGRTVVTGPDGFESICEKTGRLEISGRLFGLTVTGVKTNDGSWDALFETGYRFYSGLNDHYGKRRDIAYGAIPLIRGVNMLAPSGGTIVPSDTVEFSVNLRGILSEQLDVYVKPSFRTVGGQELIMYHIVTIEKGRSVLKEYSDIIRTDKEGGIRVGSITIPPSAVFFEKGTDKSRLSSLIAASYKESVIVNFDIYAADAEGNRVITYDNTDYAGAGYCNMWKLEGSLTGIKDTAGGHIPLKYGDVFFIDPTGSRKKYRTGVIY